MVRALLARGEAESLGGALERAVASVSEAIDMCGDLLVAADGGDSRAEDRAALHALQTRAHAQRAALAAYVEAGRGVAGQEAARRAGGCGGRLGRFERG